LRLKILKKLRTASLNSEFTGSYKKIVNRRALSTYGLFDIIHCPIFAGSGVEAWGPVLLPIF